MERLRLTYKKGKDLRFTGTLDVQRIWERALRRARLPLAYSQGFHPQARINQAAPLPLGFTGSQELVDIWFDCENLDLQFVSNSIQGALPPGMRLHNIQEVPLSEPSLPTRVGSAEYTARLMEHISPEVLSERITALMRTEDLPRIWKNKAYNLRPLIESLAIGEVADGFTEINMILALRSGAAGRPEEVLQALEIDPLQAQIDRKRLVFQNE